jgi:hypothetical protein
MKQLARAPELARRTALAPPRTARGLPRPHLLPPSHPPHARTHPPTPPAHPTRPPTPPAHPLQPPTHSTRPPTPTAHPLQPPTPPTPPPHPPHPTHPAHPPHAPTAPPQQILKCPYKSRPEENKDKPDLHYGSTVDSWAVGVMTFELLTGCPPFYDSSRANTEARIKGGAPALPAALSDGARSFISEGGRGRVGREEGGRAGVVPGLWFGPDRSDGPRQQEPARKPPKTLSLLRPRRAASPLLLAPQRSARTLRGAPQCSTSSTTRGSRCSGRAARCASSAAARSLPPPTPRPRPPTPRPRARARPRRRRRARRPRRTRTRTRASRTSTRPQAPPASGPRARCSASSRAPAPRRRCRGWRRALRQWRCERRCAGHGGPSGRPAPLRPAPPDGPAPPPLAAACRPELRRHLTGPSVAAETAHSISHTIEVCTWPGPDPAPLTVHNITRTPLPHPVPTSFAPPRPRGPLQPLASPPARRRICPPPLPRPCPPSPSSLLLLPPTGAPTRRAAREGAARGGGRAAFSVRTPSPLP